MAAGVVADRERLAITMEFFSRNGALEVDGKRFLLKGAAMKHGYSSRVPFEQLRKV